MGDFCPLVGPSLTFNIANQPGAAIIGGTGGTRPPQHFGWGGRKGKCPSH